MDLRLAMMCGSDIPIAECRLTAHQPSIKEISLIGEQDFFTGAQCILINKNMLNQDESLLTNISNFQIFMTIMGEKEAASKKNAVLQVFQILFPKYKISLLPRSIIFTVEGQVITIDENNFEYLQEGLRPILFSKNSPMEATGFNPADAKAKEIAEKLMRGRQRVAAQKGEENGSVLAQYVSVITIGVPSMSLEDCLDLTIFQLFDLVERYSLYVNWDIDIRSRLAGGKPDSKPDNWMKNIH